jgi:hypothetical protein
MRTLKHAALLVAGAVTLGTPAALAQEPVPSRTTSMPGREGRIERACGSAADSLVRFRRGVGDSLRISSPLAAPPAGTTPVTGGTQRSHEFPEYDVVLDIPNVCVQQIRLKVDTVTAKVNLDARISNLVRLSAGADVFIGDVDLTIRGVRAQALLLVDLDDVYHIVDNTLTFVDNHPEVVRQLGSTLQNTGAAVGGLVGEVVGGVTGLLLNTTRNAQGQLVQRLVENATGRIVEKTLSAAGQAIAQRAVGSVLDLPTISETAGAAGTVVRRVRDQAGKVIEFTLNKATNAISNVRLP